MEQAAQDECIDAGEYIDIAQGFERHLGKHLLDGCDLLHELREFEQGVPLGALTPATHDILTERGGARGHVCGQRRGGVVG